MELHQTISGWDIKEILYEDSNAAVCRVQKMEAGRIIESAMHLIAIPDALGNSGANRSAIRDFENIICAINAVNDSSVLHYDDIQILQQADGIMIMVRTELVVPLYSYIQRIPLEETDIVQMGMRISRALSVCYKNHIIHGDVRPENIFVTNDGQFKLGGFGLFALYNKVKSLSTVHHYEAPEVYLRKEYGEAADVYSLGLVMYQLLNRNLLPFLPSSTVVHESDYARAVETRVIGMQIPKPACGREDIKELVLKACSFRREEGFASAEEFSAALNRCVGSGYRPVKNTDDDAFERTVRIGNATTPKQDTSSNASTPIRIEGLEDNATARMPLQQQTVQQAPEAVAPNEASEVKTVNPDRRKVDLTGSVCAIVFALCLMMLVDYLIKLTPVTSYNTFYEIFIATSHLLPASNIMLHALLVLVTMPALELVVVLTCIQWNKLRNNWKSATGKGMGIVTLCIPAIIYGVLGGPTSIYQLIYVLRHSLKDRPLFRASAAVGCVMLIVSIILTVVIYRKVQKKQR